MPTPNNDDVKKLWPRNDPFGKVEHKKIHKSAEEEAEEKRRALVEAARSAGQPIPAEGGAAKQTPEEELAALRARGKSPTVIKIVDFVGAADGSMLKLTVSVRNEGPALARDVKVKCVGNARLRPLTSPMATVGDIPVKAKSLAQFGYEMPENYVEEYANFSMMADAENSKPYSQLCTVKTGRRQLSAAESIAKMDAKGKSGAKPPAKKE